MTTMTEWGGRASAMIVAAAAIGGTPDGLRAQSAEPGSRVEQAMSYHLDGGSRWRQDNEDFEPGGDEPAYWVRLMAWGPGRDVERGKTSALSPRPLPGKGTGYPAPAR